MNADGVKFSGMRVEIEGAIRVSCESLEACDGQIVAVVGRNGSGKSTLLRGLGGLLENVNGVVHVSGREIMYDKKRNVRSLCGYVDPSLAHWLPANTLVRDFLMAVWCAYNEVPWYRPYTKANVLDEIQRYGLLTNEFRDHIFFDDMGSLSSGQRQLLCLVVIFLHRARIRLVDEVSSNLDAYWARVAFEKLKITGGDEKTTTIIVSHDVELIAEFADACYIIECVSNAGTGEVMPLAANVTKLDWQGSVSDKIVRLYKGLEVQKA